MPSRRQWLAWAGLGVCAPPLGATTPPLEAWLRSATFHTALRDKMAAAHVPGLALAVIDNGRLVHHSASGWADLETRRPMTDATLLNIASVTKTFTATAVMQLREQGKLDLDAPVSPLLPFALRHPGVAERPITLRQLLTHTASIADGPAYGASYACGDPRRSLRDWLRDVFTGRDAATAFHPWAPGERHAYSNVGYGLLGLVVEGLSGRSFASQCNATILAPLGMARSRFLLDGLARSEHATPYEFVPAGRVPGSALREAGWPAPAASSQDRQTPLCLYSFATLSDGLLRSSALELARFAVACVRGGESDGVRVLSAASMAEMLRDQGAPVAAQVGFRQGLAWRALGGGVWAHMGSDPGVAAALQIRPTDGRAVVLLANGSRARPLVGQLAGELMAFGG